MATQLAERLQHLLLTGPDADQGQDLSSTDLIDDRAIKAADEDAFAHAPAVDEIAALVSNAVGPLSIGIFGPWGSGKSGLLQIIMKKLLSANVAVVALDAWKYAETPLSRQFVAQTAKQLEWQDRIRKWCSAISASASFPPSWIVDRLLAGPLWFLVERRLRDRIKRVDRKVWDDLYETHRGRRITLSGIPQAALGASLGLAAFGGLVVLFALADFLTSDTGWLTALRSVGRSMLTAGAVSTLLGAISFGISIEAERTGPATEEEFEAILMGLVRHFPGATGRIVFLVDELDRCTSEEVISTLKTIRTFLGIPNCVFIVAADREVIEDAMRSTPMHGAPPVPRNSYYGAAGSFLDKMFQAQFDLPPIRARRLSHFATGLIEGKSGVWEGLDLEEIVPVLVPRHVRSPRRVKVLLNAFGLALRVARQSHLLREEDAPNPSGREVALAKLTCLRTEFPLFARDLAEHPQLVEGLTAFLSAGEQDRIRAEATDEQMEAITDYSLDLQRVVVEYARGKRWVEQPLTSEAIESHKERSREEQRVDELLSYLLTTEDSDHPGRDLVFGQTLGDLYGLTPETALEIEALAPRGTSSPLVELVLTMDAGQQSAAVNYIADLIGEVQGPERRRTMESLLDVVDAVAPQP